MTTFSNAPRFEQLPDGSYYARAGVQSNCGGIAGIHVRIRPAAAGLLDCRVSTGDGDHDRGYGSAVPGSSVHVEYLDAIFAGAREAFEKSTHQLGATFELLDALVHAVDANAYTFRLVGYTAMSGWLRLNSDAQQPSGHSE